MTIPRNYRVKAYSDSKVRFAMAVSKPAKKAKPATSFRKCKACNQLHTSSKSGKLNNRWRTAQGGWHKGKGVNDLPREALGPFRTGPVYSFNVYRKHQPDADSIPKRASYKDGDRLQEITWRAYGKWLYEQAQEFGQKGSFAVTNFSHNRMRNELSIAHIDRIFLDSDGSGTWDKLAKAFERAGLTAILQESSSSVRDRQPGDKSLPTAWHAEIPLARRLRNPLPGLDPSSSEFSHQKRLLKEQYHWLAGFFSRLAGFKGVGKGPDCKVSCGFDPSTDQLGMPRYPSQRHTAGGVAPMLRFLDGDQALDWEELLKATGYVPSPQKEVVKNEVVLPPLGKAKEGLKIQFEGSFKQLQDDVRARINVSQFLSKFCGRAIAETGHCGCPLHAEQENLRSFHTFMGDQTGVQMWKCFGDCGDSGDVVKLACLWWRVPYRQALYQLAREVGIDPTAKVYRPQIKQKIVYADKTVPRLERVEKWALGQIVKTPNVLNFLQAVSKILLLHNQHPEVIAATLHQAMSSGGEYRRYDEVLSQVLITYGRMKENMRRKDEPGYQKQLCRGRDWLYKAIGIQALYDLAVDLSIDDKKVDFPELLKNLVNFDKASGMYESGLHFAFREIASEEDARAKYPNLDKLKNQILSPTTCCQWGNLMTGDGGRFLGKTKMLCFSVMCGYCMAIRAANEYELALEMWKKIDHKLFVVRVYGIKTVEDLDKLRTASGKSGYPKLAAIGRELGGWTLTWIAESHLAAAMIKSSVCHLARLKRSAKPGRQYLSVYKGVDPVKALNYVLRARVSLAVYLRDLVDKKEVGSLVKTLTWLSRKRMVSRSKSAVPWPTREEVKAAAKSRADEDEDREEAYPGEVVTYSLVHLRTGIVIARRERRPFRLEEVRPLLSMNPQRKIDIALAESAMEDHGPDFKPRPRRVA